MIRSTSTFSTRCGPHKWHVRLWVISARWKNDRSRQRLKYNGYPGNKLGYPKIRFDQTVGMSGRDCSSLFSHNSLGFAVRGLAKEKSKDHKGYGRLHPALKGQGVLMSKTATESKLWNLRAIIFLMACPMHLNHWLWNTEAEEVRHLVGWHRFYLMSRTFLGLNHSALTIISF